MKSKIDMAHDYAMLHMMMDRYKDVDDLEMIQWANDYADKMQAEVDKREEKKALRDAESHKTFMDMLNQKEQNHHDELVSIGLEEWQPDWSKAPDGVASWHMNENRSSYWVIGSGVHLFEDQGKFLVEAWCVRRPAPSFDYKGDWRNSLRKRP